MSLIACGINHQTASLALREKVVFPAEIMPKPLLDLVQQTQVPEALILSTCNRTEFYFASNDEAPVIDWLHNYRQLSPNELKKSLYIKHGQEAVKHALRVASGLDSMILGESQILGQVKLAVNYAQTAGTLGTRLRKLFDYVFSVSKQVRTETTIGYHSLSLAATSVDLVKHLFADITQLGVLLIGTGETIELAAQHLQAAGVRRFWLANRTTSHAEKLGKQINAHIITLGQIPDYLAQADMIVTATASPLPILGKGMVESAIKIRKHRPMFMVDLAVPRDIEHEVANLADVYLYTLDDLQKIIQQNLKNRHRAAEEAEALIENKTHQFMQLLKIQDVVPTITAYRQQAELIRDNELAKAMRSLQHGMPIENVLAEFAHTLTNKLMHEPIVELKKAIIRQH